MQAGSTLWIPADGNAACVICQMSQELPWQFAFLAAIPLLCLASPTTASNFLRTQRRSPAYGRLYDSTARDSLLLEPHKCPTMHVSSSSVNLGFGQVAISTLSTIAAVQWPVPVHDNPWYLLPVPVVQRIRCQLFIPGMIYKVYNWNQEQQDQYLFA